jgi:hypothetical protein
MRGLTIKDAVDDILGKYEFTKPKPKAIKEKAMTYNTNKPPQMEGDDLVFMQDCADNLYASPSDILRIARWRRWSPKTITRLATDRSIGIAPDGRMTFCYMTGVKYRNRDGITPKVIWKKGSRQCLWRVCQMYLANPKTVYITEGETDAITLIDDGLEPEWFNRNEMLSESHTMVVALPCATYTLSWELELFAGVDVVIWGDPDTAGVASMNRNADALTGVARSVRKASA